MGNLYSLSSSSATSAKSDRKDDVASRTSSNSTAGSSAALTNASLSLSDWKHAIQAKQAKYRKTFETDDTRDRYNLLINYLALPWVIDGYSDIAVISRLIRLFSGLVHTANLYNDSQQKRFSGHRVSMAISPINCDIYICDTHFIFKLQQGGTLHRIFSVSDTSASVSTSAQHIDDVTIDHSGKYLMYALNSSKTRVFAITVDPSPINAIHARIKPSFQKILKVSSAREDMNNNNCKKSESNANNKNKKIIHDEEQSLQLKSFVMKEQERLLWSNWSKQDGPNIPKVFDQYRKLCWMCETKEWNTVFDMDFHPVTHTYMYTVKLDHFWKRCIIKCFRYDPRTPNTPITTNTTNTTNTSDTADTSNNVPTAALAEMVADSAQVRSSGARVGPWVPSVRVEVQSVIQAYCEQYCSKCAHAADAVESKDCADSKDSGSLDEDMPEEKHAEGDTSNVSKDYEKNEKVQKMCQNIFNKQKPTRHTWSYTRDVVSNRDELVEMVSSWKCFCNDFLCDVLTFTVDFYYNALYVVLKNKMLYRMEQKKSRHVNVRDGHGLEKVCQLQQSEGEWVVTHRVDLRETLQQTGGIPLGVCTLRYDSVLGRLIIADNYNVQALYL